MIKYISTALKNYYFTPYRPMAAYLNLTERCNLKCIFCELGARENIDSGNELSSQEICRIVKELSDWGVDNIFLGGGEPFMRQDLWDILEYTASGNIVIRQILTNGILLDGLTLHQISILKRSVKTLSISLDSQDPQLHDYIRGRSGGFAKIKRFLENRDDGSPPEVYITSVITKDTYKGMPELVRFASCYNVNHIGFQPVNFYSNYPHHKAIENKDRFLLSGEEEIKQLQEAVERAISISRALKVSTNLRFISFFIKNYFLLARTGRYFFDGLINNFICSNVFNHICIDSRGNLLMCNLLPKTDNIINKDLKEAWRQNALNMREWSRRRSFYPECQSCFCGFAANARCCFIYHPMSNAFLAARLLPYYFARYRRS